MKKSRLGIAVVLFIVALALFQTDVRAAEPYEKISNSEEWAVLKRANAERVSRGLEPLGMFYKIQKAAGIRAVEIADYFDHFRPDGTLCFTALEEAGVRYYSAGENIAAGHQTPDAVMTGWMNSEGHRKNILDGSYVHLGVGYATGGSYGKNWTQMFVGGCSVTAVSVNDKGTANYALGTSIDSMNRYLIVKCDMHGISYVPVVKKMCSGYSPNKKGYQTITVKYRGKKVKVPVTVGTSSFYKKPYQVKKLKASSRVKRTVNLSWEKRNGKGYEVWMATSANGTYKKIKTFYSAGKTSHKVKNLTSGKKYYFKVRTYKKAGTKKIYGLFSKAVVVKTK